VVTYRPDKHHRRSIRLKGYDYAQAGTYFVTICTRDRLCLFGEIGDNKMRLNEAGLMVDTAWQDLPHHYPYVQLDEYVIMPNHVHGTIIVGAGLKPAPTNHAVPTKRHGLPEIVRAFKTFSARRINRGRATPGVPVWQRNYYEHVVRNEESLNHIRHYIIDNPQRWALDRENPNASEPERENAWLT